MQLPEWHQQTIMQTARIGELGTFFVLGCQKSGTTWLERLLDGHPQLACGGEGHIGDLLANLLQQAANAYNAQGMANWKLGDEDLLSLIRVAGDRILNRYIERRDKPDLKAVGDKSPEYALAMPVLDRLYPNAKYIHIIRDGRDACVSGWAHLQRAGHQSQFARFEDYAEYFAQHHWVRYIVTAQEVGAQLGDRYLEVRYESLKADPEAKVERLLEFLGVDSDEQSVAACLEWGSFQRLSGGRNPGEENAQSHFRKGVVGDWKNQFSPEAIERFERHAGATLDALGYPRGDTVEAVA